MRIVVVTWNMGYWQYRGQHSEAWKFLRDCIGPDIALLQETRPPSLNSNEGIILGEIHQGWGTAIFLRDFQANSAIEFSRYPNRTVATSIRLPSGKAVIVASIHAPIIQGRVFPHLAEIFDDIKDKVAGESCIVGGDLNSARLAEKVWPNHGHGPFFERLDESWLVDCRKKFHLEEIQTVFRPNQQYPFQDDHIFVSKDLAEKVVGYEALNTQETRRVSDHVPVIVQFEI